MSIKDFLQTGDLHRDAFPSRQLPLYIGSGTAGGCIDGYGLMHDDFFNGAQAGHNRALHYRSWRHFYRGEHAVDMVAALYHFGYAKKPILSEKGYTQSLSLYDATVDTSYTLENGTGVRIRAFCNPKYPDTLSFVYEYQGDAPALALYPEQHVMGHYGQTWQGNFTVREDGFVSRSNTCETTVRLLVCSDCGTCERVATSDALQLQFSAGKGKHLIVMLVGDGMSEIAEECTSVDAWIASSEKAWAQTYGDSYVSVPDTFVSQMTARSIYLILSSFSDQKSPPSAPMGYSGYAWPFHFPQDISYIHPALLRLGKIEHAKRIVEHYRETLEKMERISHRIYGGRGAMWAWIYPMGGGEDYLIDGAPNPFYYEIHNAAYPARMAYETAMQAGEDAWTHEVALPVIRASAEFFASHLTRGERGTWDLCVTPSMSQDEFAAPDSPNYLCALYAARYCFATAVRMGLSEYEKYLCDGLSFETLLDSKRMLYRTSEDMREETWGKEKHPVQINPLVFLPCESLNEAEINAYRFRADICEATKNDFFHGWTLATFWVAAAHMGDAETLFCELHRAEHHAYHDPESLGFYESTGALLSPYYVTTHGFWLQAVLDAFVCDYFGETKIESSVPAQWRGSEYHNLYTKDGARHSGVIQ